MRNIKLTIEYEGTNYSGWQRQKNRKSIQEEVTKAIEDLTGENIDLIGSGRTDRNVHALGQVANFYTNSRIPADRFRVSINVRLPEDIKIIKSEEVSEDFHARFSAKKKKYKYYIYNNRQPRPIFRNFSYHVKKPLDLEKMKRASREFIGTKDFESFMARDSIVDTTVRTIYEFEIEEKGNFIEITIVGKSFLRHMIRIMVGTLVYIGLDKIEEKELKNIILSKDRTKAGVTAPAHGLFLEEVYY